MAINEIAARMITIAPYLSSVGDGPSVGIAKPGMMVQVEDEIAGGEDHEE
ncbi:MAG: hypothetical protein V4477_24430 [Pseudomonadota bacterium]